MTPLSVTELFQLYAPLAGLLGLAFWTGMLTQTVRDLRKDVDDLQRAGSQSSDGKKLAVLESQMTTVLDSITSMKRSMDGVQRQLGNLMVKPAVHDFGGEHG